MAVIDEEKVLETCKDEVRTKAREAGVTDFSYIEEDLRSPCTQEIAVFRRFAEIVMQADNKTVVIDTAPTGHALLLLDSTQSYDRQIAHSEGDTPRLPFRDCCPGCATTASRSLSSSPCLSLHPYWRQSVCALTLSEQAFISSGGWSTSVSS